MLVQFRTGSYVIGRVKYIWNKANVKNYEFLKKLEAGGKPSTWFPPGGLVSPCTRDSG